MSWAINETSRPFLLWILHRVSGRTSPALRPSVYHYPDPCRSTAATGRGRGRGDQRTRVRCERLREYSARPRFQWNYDVSDHVRLETGFDVEIRPSTNEAKGDSANNDGLDQINFIKPNETKYIAGLYHAVTLEYGRWALTLSASDRPLYKRR